MMIVLPGTSCQRGSRPVRHPKITGRTSQQCNIMEIITQSGTKCYKRVYKAVEDLQNIKPSMAQLRVLTGSGRHKWGNGLERLHSTGSGWATDSSTLLFQLLAKVEDGSLLKTGHLNNQREYNYVLARLTSAWHEQSNNHATSYTMEIRSTTWQVSTQDRSTYWHKDSMASQANHGIIR